MNKQHLHVRYFDGSSNRWVDQWPKVCNGFSLISKKSGRDPLCCADSQQNVTHINMALKWCVWGQQDLPSWLDLLDNTLLAGTHLLAASQVLLSLAAICFFVFGGRAYLLSWHIFPSVSCGSKIPCWMVLLVT